MNISFLNDSNINDFINIAFAEYKVLSTFIIFALFVIVKKTKTKADNKILKWIFSNTPLRKLKPDEINLDSSGKKEKN